MRCSTPPDTDTFLCLLVTTDSSFEAYVLLRTFHLLVLTELPLNSSDQVRRHCPDDGADGDGAGAGRGVVVELDVGVCPVVGGAVGRIGCVLEDVAGLVAGVRVGVMLGGVVGAAGDIVAGGAVSGIRVVDDRTDRVAPASTNRSWPAAT